MNGESPKLTELDAWAEDHSRRRMDELYNESILSKEKMLLYLRQRQIISRYTLGNQLGIPMEEEIRRLRAERIG
jgi:hypothetical protein